jgi:hypothetical protein
MKKGILAFGIYSFLVFVTGTISIVLNKLHAQEFVNYAELHSPIDMTQAIFQIIVFFLCSVTALMAFSNKAHRKYFKVSLLLLVIWYLVFEIVVLGWARDFELARLVASAIFVLSPTVLMLYFLIAKNDKLSDN